MDADLDLLQHNQHHLLHSKGYNMSYLLFIAKSHSIVAVVRDLERSFVRRRSSSEKGFGQVLSSQRQANFTIDLCARH
jgi:hypothetical protein